MYNKQTLLNSKIFKCSFWCLVYFVTALNLLANILVETETEICSKHFFVKFDLYLSYWSITANQEISFTDGAPIRGDSEWFCSVLRVPPSELVTEDTGSQESSWGSFMFLSGGKKERRITWVIISDVSLYCSDNFIF